MESVSGDQLAVSEVDESSIGELIKREISGMRASGRFQRESYYECNFANRKISREWLERVTSGNLHH